MKTTRQYAIGSLLLAVTIGGCVMVSRTVQADDLLYFIVPNSSQTIAINAFRGYYGVMKLPVYRLNRAGSLPCSAQDK